MVPSQCHRTTIRWLHDVIAMASRRRVAFLRPSASFVFPSCCLRETKMPDAADDYTKPTRTRHDGIRCTHDGITKGKMDTRTQHEHEPSCVHRAILWHAKDFGSAHDVTAEHKKINRWQHDGVRWHKMASRMPRWLHDQSRI